MKSRSFVVSALILAMGGFFAKAIGALYKIPLTNILGSSGMGLYYLVFPVYSLIITLCSSGINVSLSTEVAKCRRARHRYNEQKLLRVGLILSFCLSLIFTIVIIILSRSLSELQGNINAKLGYIAIAPAIIISSLIATLRGYFQGVENMVPTTVSMIVEQIIKLSVGLILAHKLCIYGIEFAVLGAVIGVTISEVVALIIISINFLTFKGQLYFNYRNLIYKGKKVVNVKSILKVNKKYNQCNTHIKFKTYLCSSKKIRYTNKIAIKKLLKVIIPATFSSIILPIATMLDSFMIINILVDSGYSSLISTSLYGLSSGVVQTLISLPTILVAGVSTTIVPSLSGVVEEHEKINQRVKFFIKTTLVLSVFMFVIMFVFAKEILMFLYGDGLTQNVIDELYYATKMLQLSSASILYYAFLQTFIAILQTIDKPHIPCFVLLGSLVVRVLFTNILVSIPNINIFGSIIANIIFLSLSVIILVCFIKKSIEFDFNFLNNLIMPLIIGLLVMGAIKGIYFGLSQILNYFIAMVISAIIGLAIFVVWVYFSKIFSEKEKRKYFKFKKKLTKTKL